MRKLILSATICLCLALLPLTVLAQGPVQVPPQQQTQPGMQLPQGPQLQPGPQAQSLTAFSVIEQCWNVLPKIAGYQTLGNKVFRTGSVLVIPGFAVAPNCQFYFENYLGQTPPATAQPLNLKPIDLKSQAAGDKISISFLLNEKNTRLAKLDQKIDQINGEKILTLVVTYTVTSVGMPAGRCSPIMYQVMKSDGILSPEFPWVAPCPFSVGHQQLVLQVAFSDSAAITWQEPQQGLIFWSNTTAGGPRQVSGQSMTIAFQRK